MPWLPIAMGAIAGSVLAVLAFVLITDPIFDELSDPHDWGDEDDAESD